MEIFLKDLKFDSFLHVLIYFWLQEPLYLVARSLFPKIIIFDCFASKIGYAEAPPPRTCSRMELP